MRPPTRIDPARRPAARAGGRAAPAVGRAAPAGERRSERGVSIVLAMLVLLVLVVVVFEIRYSVAVDQDQARQIVDAKRMGLLADAGRRQAESALILDIEQGSEGEDAGTGGAGGDASGMPFGDPGAGGGGGDEDGGDGGGDAAGEGGAPSVAEVTASTDSRLDEWNDPLALAPAFGDEFQVLVEVEDEDGKINLLGIWTADQEQREVQRTTVTTLLDKAFEGTSLDISFPDAIAIIDRLDDWARGNRGAFDPVPQPPLKKSNAEDAAESGSLDTEILTIDEKHRPLTLGELELIEGIRPEHLLGFVENDEFHPGLDRYLTVWSQLELKPPPPEADPFADSPFTKFTQGSLFDQTMGEPDENAQEEPPDLEPAPTNDGLVNINTAPLVVLRALASPEVPTSFLEKIVEFRKKIDELREAGSIDSGESLFSQDTFAMSGDEEQDSSSEDDEDEDPTQYVFSTVEEVIDKVEQEFELTLGLDPAVQSEFLGRLAVTSNVFTIKVVVYTLAKDDKTGEERFGRRSTYRTVVWRMVLDDGCDTLTLLPLEPYHDPRRLIDYELDLDEFGEDVADRQREREQKFGLGF